MRGAAVALVFCAVAPPAHAEPLSSVSWRSFEAICLKASEESIASRDLAEQAGLTREAGPPAALIGMLPLGESTASYLALADTGRVHVISTVVPPPATPFSCMVAVEGGDDATWSGLLDGMSATPRYASNTGSQNDTGSGFDFQFDDGGAINRVIGIRHPFPTPGVPNMMFLAFRTQQ